MVNAVSPSSLVGEPGQFRDLLVDDRFHFDSGSGSYSGAGTSVEFIMPSFDYGEVWAIKMRLTLSSEPTSDIIVLELMDEDESNYIQKATIPEYGGNDAEINTVVTWDMAAWDSGSGSPDTRVTVVGSDTGNYFIDVIGIQLRRGYDGSSRIPSGLSQESWTDTEIN
jgi:hypothetical protein